MESDVLNVRLGAKTLAGHQPSSIHGCRVRVAVFLEEIVPVAKRWVDDRLEVIGSEGSTKS